MSFVLLLLSLLPILGAVVASGVSNSEGASGEALPSSAPDDAFGAPAAPIKESDDVIDQIVAASQAEGQKKAKARSGKVTSSPVGEGDLRDGLQSVTPVDEGPEGVFAKALKEMGVEDEQPAKPEEEKEEELDPTLDPKSRAADTIRKTRARAQAAEAQVKEAEGRAWEYAQAHQQLREQAQQQVYQMREQMAAMQAKFEAMQQYAPKQPADPLQQAEQEWLHKIESAVDKRVSPLQQENQQLKQYLKQQQETQQIEQLKSRHSLEANKALSEVVFKNVDADTAKAMGPTMRRLLFAIASDTNTSLPEAANSVRTLMMKYAVGYLRGQAKQVAPQRERSQAVPRTAPRGQPGGDGENDPSYDLLKHNGLDLAAWYLKGKPLLKPLPRG